MISTNQWDVLACVALAIVGGVGSVRPSSENVRAAEWIASHATTLPSDLNDILLYPEAYRHAIYTELAPKARLQLWRAYLSRVQEIDGRLTPTQVAFLARFSAALTERDFDSGFGTRDELLALQVEAEHYLGAEQKVVLGSMAWSRLKPSRNPFQHGLLTWLNVGRVRIAEMATMYTVHAEDEVGNCDCYVAGEGRYDCGGDRLCLPDTPNAPHLCQELTSGCDLFQNHPCDGLCRDNLE